MTGHLIGQNQHHWVKVISVNTQHGDRHRIATKTFRERVSVDTLRMIEVRSKYYEHWPMIRLRYREHMTPGYIITDMQNIKAYRTVLSLGGRSTVTILK